MYFFKNTAGNWIIGPEPTSLKSKVASELRRDAPTVVTVRTIETRVLLIDKMEVTTIKKNEAGDLYTSYAEFLTAVSDFFDNAPITAEEVDAKIGAEVDTLSDRIDTVEGIANAASSGSLGSIKPTDAAPTPARNGNYTFSIGGNKPAWLTAEAGITEVKAGDGVAVVYTEPNVYSYTHVDVSSAFVTMQKLSELGCMYKGIATPATVPGTPDGKEFYFAIDAGTYSNFGGYIHNGDQLVILTNLSGVWASQEMKTANRDFLNNRNFSLWNRGTVTFNKTTGKLTISSDCYIMLAGRIGILQGGSGTNLITDFQTAASETPVNIIYVDIPITGAIETRTIVSERHDAMTTVATGFQRIFLGACYCSNSVYDLNIPGIYEKDVERRMDSINTALSTLISTNKTDADQKINNSNFSLCNLGTVTFNKTTGNLTISDSFYVVLPGLLGTIQGGTGTNLVTDFQTALIGTGVHIIYIDIPSIGEIGTVNLKSESFAGLTSLTSGKQRLIIGAAYYNNTDSTYYLTFPGIYEKDVDRRLQSVYTDIANNTLGIQSIKGESVVTGNDSTMGGANSWIVDLGALTFDVNTTVAGKMFLNFATGTNQAIKLLNKLVIGHSYTVKVKARVNSGTGSMALRLGSFFETPLNNKVIQFTPTETETEFTGTIIAASVDVWLGAILAANNGTDFEIDDIQFFDLTEQSLKALDERLDVLESTISGTTAHTFHTAQFLESLSKYDKPLTKLGVVGDSLMANAIGGAIPVEFDEGVTKRPIRLVSNQIARRIYDLISWNKATHRRLDDVDWTKSGTWTTITSGLFEGAQDTYHTSSTANSYVEITIPNGKENFAFVCRRDAGLGVLNITLNGGNISTYGSSTVDLDRTKTGGSSDLGNAFHTVLYTGLPAGDNIIRISKENNTDEVQIWGGFYWSGNTLIVHNVAHGGHNLLDLLSQHLQAEVVENDFDAILFEIPLMNEAGNGTGTAAAQVNLETILGTIVNGKDVAFMSCQPFGTDPTDGTPNYYEIYSDPSMEDYNTALRNTLFNHNQPFVDVFSFFKKKIENRGGTLETGEGGLWYTHDGQHQSEAGMIEYWNLIRFLFENKPIRY